jgi:hypothetical protein
MRSHEIIKKAEVYKPSDLAMPIEKEEGSQLLATPTHFIRKQSFQNNYDIGFIRLLFRITR